MFWRLGSGYHADELIIEILLIRDFSLNRERYPKNIAKLLNPPGSGRRAPGLRPVAPIAIHI